MQKNLLISFQLIFLRVLTSLHSSFHIKTNYGKQKVLKSDWLTVLIGSVSFAQNLPVDTTPRILL